MDPLDFRLKNYAEVEPISGKPFSSKALARMLPARRRAFRLGASAARAAADARPRRLARRLGRRHRDISGVHVRGRRRGRCCAATAAASWRSARMTWGRAPGPRWRRSRPMGSGSISIGSSSGPGSSDLPDAGIAGGSAHTATAGMAIHNAGADVIARLADLATNDERSPLFGAGNAGVIARGGRLFRRDDREPQRKLCRYPRPRRPRADRGRGNGRRSEPGGASQDYAMHAHGAVFAEVKVDPDLGQMRVTRAGRRLRRRTDHQSAHGAEPALWRHDLGRVVRAARAGRHGSRAPAVR